MLPVLLQDPAGHAGVTEAKALSEDRESHKDKACSRHGQEGTKWWTMGPLAGWGLLTWGHLMWSSCTSCTCVCVCHVLCSHSIV